MWEYQIKVDISLRDFSLYPLVVKCRRNSFMWKQRKSTNCPKCCLSSIHFVLLVQRLRKDVCRVNLSRNQPLNIWSFVSKAFILNWPPYERGPNEIGSVSIQLGKSKPLHLCNPNSFVRRLEQKKKWNWPFRLPIEVVGSTQSRLTTNLLRRN